ncbi:Type IV pilus modification protein PilV [Burkholderiales bacterium 8X]|nr:Type IV pilus modification protein PilV [Burkholderiales bacterium 8X]
MASSRTAFGTSASSRGRQGLARARNLKGRASRAARASHQRGLFLIEALVAIALFAIGILGMVGVSARTIAAQSDAEYRNLAATIAGQVAQQAWLNVDRVTGLDAATRAASLKASLLAFRHQPSGDACNFSGDVSALPAVTAWSTAALKLPGATAAMQQVRVDTDPAGFNKLTVTVCWKVPANPVPRKHVLATFVN